MSCTPDSYIFVLDAPAPGAKRIPIAKLGSYSDPRYGAFDITDGNFESWDAHRSKLPGGRILVDVDHASDRSGGARSTRAAGWISGLVKEGDLIYGEWTPTPYGEQIVKDGEFAFTSAAYGPFRNERGETFPDVLQTVSFTNKPALTDLPAVSLASAGNVARAALARPTAPPESQPKLLDRPAGALLNDPAQRTTLDRHVRCLSRTAGRPYADCVDLLRRAHDDASEQPWSGPSTVGRMLKAAGVRDLASFQTDLKTLERRDQEAARMLDAATAPLQSDRLDGQGRVRLAEGFDAAHILHDAEARERRWREARRLDSRYADRGAWERDDLMHLDADTDLLRTLERPLQAGRARQTVTERTLVLDAAIASAGDARGRARSLEAAIAGLAATSPDQSAAAGETTAEPASRDLGSLTLKQLDATLKAWDGGKGLAMEAAIKRAVDEHPAEPRDAGHRSAPTPRHLLDSSVRDYMRGHPDVSYVQALEQVTGMPSLLD